jgi:hypothetical protein
MSALPPIADMDRLRWHVRFVPIADIQKFGSHRSDHAKCPLGSLADIPSLNCNVHFTPNSGQFLAAKVCPLCANSGHRVRKFAFGGI